jgi:hypothetical protein
MLDAALWRVPPTPPRPPPPAPHAARLASAPPPPVGADRPAPQIAADVAARFVRLSGILFDRVNAEEWPAACSAAFGSLSALLAHPAARDALGRQPRADAAPLHLVVAAVFAVHNTWEHGAGARGGGGGAGAAGAVGGGASARLAAHGGGVGDAAQRLLQRSRALALTFRCVGVGPVCDWGLLVAAAAAVACAGGLCGRPVRATIPSRPPAPLLSSPSRVGAHLCNAAADWCAAAGPASPGCPALLVACHVLLQWLAAHPHYASGVSPGGALSPLAAPGTLDSHAPAAAAAAADEAARRAAFWPAAARLAAALAAAAPDAAARHAAARRGGRGGGAGGGAGLARAGSGPLEDAAAEGGALPEELELLGFEPLRSKHRGQSVGHASDAARGGEEEAALRAARALHECAAVAGALEADLLALEAAAGAGAFGEPGGARALLVAARGFVDAVAALGGGGGGGGGGDGMDVDRPGWPVAGGGAAAAAGGGAGGAGGAAANGAGPGPEPEGIEEDGGEREEEEEVIVFQPRKGAPPPAPAAAPPPPLPQQLLLHRGLSAGAPSPPPPPPRSPGPGGSSGGGGGGSAGAARRALGPVPVSVVIGGAPGAAPPRPGADAPGSPQQQQQQPQQQQQQQPQQQPGSTELDLQQAHAASAALLSRLAARAGPTAPAPQLYGQQQQQQPPGEGAYPGYPAGASAWEQLDPYAGAVAAAAAAAAAAAQGGASPMDEDFAGLADIESLVGPNRASLELEATARAAALHILSPGAPEGPLAAAAAREAPGGGGPGGVAGLLAGAAAAAPPPAAPRGALLGDGHAATAGGGGGGRWGLMAAPPPRTGSGSGAGAGLAEAMAAAAAAGGGSGRGSLLAASGASSLAGTPRSNASGALLGGGLFAPPSGAAAAGHAAGTHGVARAADVLRLGSASLVPLPGDASGASGSGYAMFAGPDLFAEVVPRHRRVSSGLGSGRSSAADSGGAPGHGHAPGRASSPGLSLLDHLAEQAHAAGAAPRPGGGGGPPPEGGFLFGEALFPPPAGGDAAHGAAAAAPGVLLPPRDADGGYNPFL